MLAHGRLSRCQRREKVQLEARHLEQVCDLAWEQPLVGLHLDPRAFVQRAHETARGEAPLAGEPSCQIPEGLDVGCRTDENWEEMLGQVAWQGQPESLRDPERVVGIHGDSAGLA